MVDRRQALRRILQASSPLFVLPARAAESMSTFNWLPTESAPRLYPVRILKGEVQLADGNAEEFPQRRNANNGWGKRGSTRIVGPERKAVPVSVELRWFSWTENAFFAGRFALPKDKVVSFLATPLARSRGSMVPEPFTRLIVGMAPDGFVAVWLDAGGEVVEIDNYQAARVDRPWTDVAPNRPVSREAFIGEVLTDRLTPDELAHVRQSSTDGLFRAYHQRYRWKPNLVGTGHALYMNFESLNGENARLWPTGAAVPCETRPVPLVVEAAWTPPGGPSVRAVVTMDPSETLAGFRKLSQNDPNRTLTLNIQTGSGGAAISLQDGQFLLPFKSARSQLFSL